MSESPNLPDGQLDVIFHYGAYPLWVYLQEVIGINIVDVCPRVAKEEPVLTTDLGKLVARVVELPHDNELTHMHNNDVIFFINSINVVFESLKAGTERDGVKILEGFKFKLDPSHNMYLVGTETELPISDKAIAVITIN